jgi:hypothetical protein
LTIYGPNGQPYGGALVTLYPQNGPAIEQGFTDNTGQLDIYGAAEGDRLQAASPDGTLAGSMRVGSETNIHLFLGSRVIFLPIVLKEIP